MLKIGELASRSGLTVRALHHYDSIGLLTPSARSDAGYRLYNRDDIARLHQIQALRRFGMALADIGSFLANPDTSLAEIISRQIAALDHQIAEAARLRGQLEHLQGQLRRGEEPELSAWLTTLEQMTVYDKYFSKEELSRLPLYHDNAARAEWAGLVAAVQEKINAGIPPSDPAAQQLAAQWMNKLQRDTGNDPEMLVRLDNMWAAEPSVQENIPAAIRQYILAANTESKLAIYSKYMLPTELATMRKHFECRSREWPGLIGEIRAQMAADPSPQSPAAVALAKRWFDLFTDMIGHAPEARLRFRAAHENEAALQDGRLMTEELLNFLRQAITYA